MAANLVAPTASWVSRPNVRSPILLPLRAAVIADPDGGWMIDTESDAEAFITEDPDGGVMVDTDAASGLTITVAPGMALAYEG